MDQEELFQELIEIFEKTGEPEKIKQLNSLRADGNQYKLLDFLKKAKEDTEAKIKELLKGYNGWSSPKTKS